MLPARKIRFPTDSSAASSKYTGHGSSVVQLMPAHSIFSAEHWNGISMGSPELVSNDGSGGLAAGSGAGACARSKQQNAIQIHSTLFMLPTILARTEII